MTDYSDLFFLIGAMIAFSFLSRGASNMFFFSNNALIQSDIETTALALGQDIIDEAKWAKSATVLNSIKDEYNNQSITVSIGESDEYQISYDVTMSVSDVSITGSNVTNKKVVVTVDSEYLPAGSQIRLEYIKNFN